MARCPSAVPAAETTVEAGKGSVVVTVTAREKGAVVEIQRRAAALADAAADGADSTEICPVVMVGARRKVDRQKNGIKVILTPEDAGKVGELVARAKQRAEAIAEARAAEEAHDLDVPGEDEEPADEE
jgi:hypothetical protein